MSNNGIADTVGKLADQVVAAEDEAVQLRERVKHLESEKAALQAEIDEWRARASKTDTQLGKVDTNLTTARRSLLWLYNQRTLSHAEKNGAIKLVQATIDNAIGALNAVGPDFDVDIPF